MAELIPDSQYGPHELPADAVLVARWDSDGHPPQWVMVGVVVGTLDEALLAGGEHLAGHGVRSPDLLATKVGGNASKVKRVPVSEETTRTARLEDVPMSAAAE